ncbi:MAG: L-threonylcarbamoyladenylate synthase [bacterium]
MKARLVKVTRQLPEWEAVHAAAGVIASGGIVALPTDTTYGLAASVWCERAVERLRRIKTRAEGKSFVVLAADTDWVMELAARVTPPEKRLMDAYWPGPLTIVFEASDAVPRYLVGRDRTIAVRVPDDALAQSLLRACGSPLVAPSANLRGQEPARSAEEVRRDFAASVDLILDGGPVESGVPSTIVVVRRRRFEVLREGRLSLKGARI